MSKVLLGPHEDEGNARTEVGELRDPGVGNIVQAVGVGNAEADQDDVRLRVGERSALQKKEIIAFALTVTKS